MKKSLLDIIKEKTGEKFDVSNIDFSNALMERVQMNSKTFGTVVGDTGVLVGFEAEWKSESFKSEWDSIGATPYNCDLYDARKHSGWDESAFTDMFNEWLDDRRDNFRDYNSSEIFEYAKEHMVSDYEDECLDDDAVRAITGMNDGAFEDEVRQYHGIDEEDEDGNLEDVDDSQKLEFLKDKYMGEMEEYIRETWADEWQEYEDKYIERNMYDDSEDDYFEENRSDVLSRMSIDDDDDTEPTDEMMDELKIEIEHATGIDIVETSSNYDGTSKREDGYKGYYLETDSGDAELISPPQPIDKTLEDLEQILSFISKNGEAGSGNGLHVSLSIEGKTAADYDPLKILMFLGEDYLLAQFDRSNNSFTKPHGKNIMSAKDVLNAVFELGDFDAESEEVKRPDPRQLVLSVLNSRKSDKYSKFVDLMVRNMWGDRYRTFNLKHLYDSVDLHSVEGVSKQFADTPYIEFRIMGNRGYETKYQTIKDTILRYGYVMRLATDPQAEREEYAKKLYRFFTALIDASDKNANIAPPISAMNKKLVQNFASMFRKDFINGSVVFGLGKRRMNPEVALGYFNRILSNQIEQWMHEKVYETWMLMAMIISKAEYQPLGINIKDYVPTLRVVAQRMRLSSKHRFGLVADGALISDNYQVDGEFLDEHKFKEFIMKRAEELDIIN